MDARDGVKGMVLREGGRTRCVRREPEGATDEACQAAFEVAGRRCEGDVRVVHALAKVAIQTRWCW